MRRSTGRPPRWRAACELSNAVLDELFGTSAPGVRETWEVLRGMAGITSDSPGDGRTATPPRGMKTLTVIAPYRPPLSGLITTAKYDAISEPWRVLGHRLGLELSARFDWSVATRRPIVVPVPSPTWRRWHRGIDHTALLASSAATCLGVRSHRWLRSEWRSPQAMATSSDRATVARSVGPSVFWWASRLWSRRQRLAVDRPVVVIDDVCTTGATLEACGGVLSRMGFVSVHGAVVARCDLDQPAGFPRTIDK
ncbi:MAG: hypothetical protein CMJ51_00925 [Planctomycetaceae bacterium]|nr:hypothetical protein [Planctomycetaceae bacterium]